MDISLEHGFYIYDLVKYRLVTKQIVKILNEADTSQIIRIAEELENSLNKQIIEDDIVSFSENTPVKNSIKLIDLFKEKAKSEIKRVLERKISFIESDIEFYENLIYLLSYYVKYFAALNSQKRLWFLDHKLYFSTNLISLNKELQSNLNELKNSDLGKFQKFEVIEFLEKISIELNSNYFFNNISLKNIVDKKRKTDDYILKSGLSSTCLIVIEKYY